MRPLLELNNISYSYHTIDGETKALSDISFQLAPGEFAAVVGPSGCGKSTLLSLIAGLIEAENGTIFLDGEPSEKSFRKSAKIGYMLQHDHLFEWRSILKNVLLGAEINKSVSQETKQRAKELLRQYGLKRFINSRPSELSGGMRQRAALIRTLMPNPELLLLDEPFSALDYQTRLTVSDDIGKIIKHSGKTALLVTHDLSEAISLADRIIILTKRPAHIARIVPIAPLLIVWLGATSKTIIIAGMSVAIFGSILNLYTAFINVDQEKIKLIYTLHGNRRHALTKVVLPSSVPAIISNMKVNIGLCLVGVIIGEFLAAKSGLGYLIIYSSQVFKMDWLLMSIILLCIMAMGLYALINVVEKRVLKKY